LNKILRSNYLSIIYITAILIHPSIQVGAPPEVLERLTATAAKLDARPPGRHDARDPELDQFMVRSSPPTPATSSYIVHDILTRPYDVESINHR
jgi:hypothetical protein